MTIQTSTTWAVRQLSEMLMPVALKAHTPKTVLLPHCNEASIDGLPTDNVKITQDKDIGPAVDLTENVDLVANVDAGYETPVTITPSEIGAKMTLTRKAARRASPGFTAAQVQAAFASNDPTLITRLMLPKVIALLGALDEKVEDSLLNQLALGTNSVGTTNTEITISVLINGLFKMKTLDIGHEDWLVFLGAHALKQLQLEQAAMSNGTGAVFFTQGDLSFFNHRPDMSRNGYRNGIMQLPIYEPSHSLRTLMNSDVDEAGAIIARGVGSPSEDGNGQIGAFSIIEGAPPILDTDRDASARRKEVIATQEVGVGINDQNNFVAIVSKAAA